jgi:hypothetical protein
MYNYTNKVGAKLFASDASFTTNKALAQAIGTINAIVIQEIISYYSYAQSNDKIDENGFFIYHMIKLQQETGLSEYDVRRAYTFLKNHKLFVVEKRGMPIKSYVRLNDDWFNILVNFIEVNEAKKLVEEEAKKQAKIAKHATYPDVIGTGVYNGSEDSIQRNGTAYTTERDSVYNGSIYSNTTSNTNSNTNTTTSKNEKINFLTDKDLELLAETEKQKKEALEVITPPLFEDRVQLVKQYCEMAQIEYMDVIKGIEIVKQKNIYQESIDYFKKLIPARVVDGLLRSKKTMDIKYNDQKHKNQKLVKQSVSNVKEITILPFTIIK